MRITAPFFNLAATSLPTINSALSLATTTISPGWRTVSSSAPTKGLSSSPAGPVNVKPTRTSRAMGTATTENFRNIARSPLKTGTDKKRGPPTEHRMAPMIPLTASCRSGVKT